MKNKRGDLNIGMIMLGTFLIVFWLVFPYCMKLFYSSNYSELSSDTYSTVKSSNSIGGILGGVSIWFKYLILDIPDVPTWGRIIVHSLQLLSLLFIIGMFLDLVITVLSKLPL